MKILVIQQKMIGDVLTSSILFEALRKKYPGAELHYLIHKHTCPVVENNPHIDRFLLFDPSAGGRPDRMFSLIKKVKQEKYSIVIDVYAKIQTALITCFSGAEKRISNYKSYTSAAYTDTFPLATKPKTNAGLAVENRMTLLQALSPDFPLEIKPKIYLTEVERTAALKMLNAAGVSLKRPLYMIAILGSSAEKTYPLKYMAQVLDHLVLLKKAQLLFNYIPKQEPQARELLELCDPGTRKCIFFDVFGKDLREFMAITAHCDGLIGNEGGAVNMAKALEVPTFAIFSPQIQKESWSMYEDGVQHVSVHLKDFEPGKFRSLKKKELAERNGDLYQEFLPAYVKEKLEIFLGNN